MPATPSKEPMAVCFIQKFRKMRLYTSSTRISANLFHLYSRRRLVTTGWKLTGRQKKEQGQRDQTLNELLRHDKECSTGILQFHEILFQICSTLKCVWNTRRKSSQPVFLPGWSLFSQWAVQHLLLSIWISSDAVLAPLLSSRPSPT